MPTTWTAFCNPTEATAATRSTRSSSCPSPPHAEQFHHPMTCSTPPPHPPPHLDEPTPKPLSTTPPPLWAYPQIVDTSRLRGLFHG